MNQPTIFIVFIGLIPRGVPKTINKKRQKSLVPEGSLSRRGTICGMASCSASSISTCDESHNEVLEDHQGFECWKFVSFLRYKVAISHSYVSLPEGRLRCQKELGNHFLCFKSSCLAETWDISKIFQPVCVWGHIFFAGWFRCFQQTITGHLWFFVWPNIGYSWFKGQWPGTITIGYLLCVYSILASGVIYSTL